MTAGSTASGAISGASAGSSFGPWGAAIGGVVGGIGGFFSGKSSKNSARKAAEENYKYNKKLMKYQNDLAVENYKHRYQWQVEDLEAAGINKLYGIGGTSGVPVASATMSGPDYNSAESNTTAKNRNIQDAITNGVQLAQEWTGKKAQIRLLENQANTEEYNTHVKRLEVTQRELDILEKKTHLNYYEKMLKTQLQKEIVDINKAMAEITKYNLENEVNSAKNRFYRDHPTLTKVGEGATHLRDLTGLPVKVIDSILNFKKGPRLNRSSYRKK